MLMLGKSFTVNMLVLEKVSCEKNEMVDYCQMLKQSSKKKRKNSCLCVSGFDVITGLFQGVVVVDLDSQ